MKRTSNLFVFLVFLTATLSAKDVPAPKGSYKVVPVEELETVSYQSVVYALPKTELDIEITAKKTTKLRGPFYQYSDRFLGLKDVITEDEVNWSLEHVEMQSHGIPDDTRKYAILFNGNTSAPFISYANNGCIAGVNAKGDGAGNLEIEKNIQLSDAETSFDFVPYTEEMLIANSTAKMAEEAAAYIKRIRENRTLLISGEASTTPADGDALAIALEKMDELEMQFIELFRGKVVTEVVTNTIQFLPTKQVERELLFRFSKFKGLVDKADLSGEPVTLGLTLLDQSDLPNTKPEAKYDDKGKLLKGIPDAGIYYCMPKSANVSITYAGNEVFSNRFSFGQFGQVLNLPTSLLDSQESAILFDTKTGAIQSIVK